MIYVQKYRTKQKNCKLGEAVYHLKIDAEPIGLMKHEEKFYLTDSLQYQDADLMEKDLIELLMQMNKRGLISKVTPFTPSEFRTKFFSGIPFEAVYFSQEEIDKLLS